MTALYGVIGDPIAQSLSPLIHNGWMRDYGIDAIYSGFQVRDGELEEALKTLAHRGVTGLNITMPHKLAALTLSGTVTPRAKLIQAANTLWRPGDGSWHADNTDAPGFLRALDPYLDKPITEHRMLIIGAGGAARGVVFALGEEGVSVTVANRTLQRAEELASTFAEFGVAVIPLDDALAEAATFDVVVNTTSLAHLGKSLPLAPGRGGLLFELSYGPAASHVVRPAREMGWKTADGLSMLVHQAAFAFERWFGIMPEANKAFERCRAVLEMA